MPFDYYEHDEHDEREEIERALREFTPLAVFSFWLPGQSLRLRVEMLKDDRRKEALIGDVCLVGLRHRHIGTEDENFADWEEFVWEGEQSRVHLDKLLVNLWHVLRSHGVVRLMFSGHPDVTFPYSITLPYVANDDDRALRTSSNTRAGIDWRLHLLDREIIDGTGLEQWVAQTAEHYLKAMQQVRSAAQEGDYPAAQNIAQKALRYVPHNAPTAKLEPHVSLRMLTWQAVDYFGHLARIADADDDLQSVVDKQVQQAFAKIGLR
jgi:hypothetical protein